MKGILSAFLGFFIFFQSINVMMIDILKLNELIEHAQFHEEEYGDDWLTFYIKHFGDESENHLANQHQEKHNKLPIHDHLNISNSPVFVLSNSLDIKLNDNFQTNTTVYYSYIEMCSNFIGKDIFQPPILA